MDDIQIISTTAGSPAENDQDLLKALGTMTVRFNVLENYLSNLIAIKAHMLLIGPSYEYISKEMMFFQKIKLAGNFITDPIKSRLMKLNDSRNKIIHGLYTANGATGKISLSYRNEIIEDLIDFVQRLNEEISNLGIEIHKIMIYPHKLGEATDAREGSENLSEIHEDSLTG